MALELSILIATMPSRRAMLNNLMDSLNVQFYDVDNIDVNSVEILTDNSLAYNIGCKRNYLLNKAKGKYIVFIDDDDKISENYISLILKAVQSNPDCVGINGTIDIKGETRKWFISKQYLTWFERNKVYFRTPNHISPVKREIALKVGFPPIKHGEDAAYSQNILPYLKTETIIKEPIYFYYPSKK